MRQPEQKTWRGAQSDEKVASSRPCQVSWSWSSEVLSPGAVKFFEFKQILPAGLGPSETRVPGC